MPAIVRVKRRIDEEPLSAFILNCKKRRLHEAQSGSEGKEDTSTILKFAATLTEQDDSATKQYLAKPRLTKEAAKKIVHGKHVASTINPTTRARQEMRQSLQENRFRIVNLRRTVFGDESEKSEPTGNDAAVGATTDDASTFQTTTSLPPSPITIVDIEKQSPTSKPITTAKTALTDDMPSTSTGATALQQQKEQSDSDIGYVYDLYVPEDNQYALDVMDESYLSVRAYDCDLVYEDVYKDESSDDLKSEDSNDENYYANDYPDEEDDDEGGDDDKIEMGGGIDDDDAPEAASGVFYGPPTQEQFQDLQDTFEEIVFGESERRDRKKRSQLDSLCYILTHSINFHTDEEDLISSSSSSDDNYEPYPLAYTTMEDDFVDDLDYQHTHRRRPPMRLPPYGIGLDLPIASTSRGVIGQHRRKHTKKRVVEKKEDDGESKK